MIQHRTSQPSADRLCKQGMGNGDGMRSHLIRLSEASNRTGARKCRGEGGEPGFYNTSTPYSNWGKVPVYLSFPWNRNTRTR